MRRRWSADGAAIASANTRIDKAQPPASQPACGVAFKRSGMAARARRRAGHRQGSDGLPFAALRVPCDARIPGPSHNSLRSLRSLRSDTCDESVDEARQMRARPGTLRFSAAPIRPACAPPGALREQGFVFDAAKSNTGSWPEGGAALGRLCAAEERRACGRAQSALRQLTRRPLSERSEQSEGSELGDGPQDRVPQGTRSVAKGQHSEPRRRTAFGSAQK